MGMLTDDVWQTANGVLSILGLFLSGIILTYLVRKWRKTYNQPIRFITIAFCFVVLGHSIKDSSGYMMRAWGIEPEDWVIITAMVLVGAGKFGCILIWSDPRWGHKPWIIAALLVVAFLVFNRVYY